VSEAMNRKLFALVMAFVFGASAVASTRTEELTRRSIERCAVEAVIWGMPAVNYDLMYQAMVRDAKAGRAATKSFIGRVRSAGKTKRSRATEIITIQQTLRNDEAST
jgi:hypothetical protein